MAAALFYRASMHEARNSQISKIKVNDALLTSDELESHAREIAFDQELLRQTNMSTWPVRKMNESYKYIHTVYKSLNEEILKARSTSPAAEWLLDNFYIIEEQVKNIRRDLTKKHYKHLPALKYGPMNGYARIYTIALELVAHTDGKIDDRILDNYIKAYQTHNTLTNGELWAFSIMIRLALIEKLKYISEKILEIQQQRLRADNLVDKLTRDGLQDVDELVHAILSEIRSTFDIKPSFIEHLVYRLRTMGRSCAPVIRFVDDKLIKHGMSIDAVIQKEHNMQAVNKVSIENCIMSLKFISSLDWVDVFESLSQVEHILRQDPSSTYPEMDLPSRDYYRKRIERLSRLYNASESHIAAEIVELARNFASGGSTDDERKKHIGYYIVDRGINTLEQKIGYKPQGLQKFLHLIKSHPTAFYTGSILMLTLLAAAVASALTYNASASEHAYYSVIHNTVLALTAGVITIIPVSEISINVLNWLLSRIIKPSVFPRINYRNSIPEENTTIVVVPALIPDEKRIRGLIENLEVHYLSNKDKNVYFALAGDFKDSKNEDMPNDDSIIQTGIQLIKELNSKYPSEGYERFYYFHRHRQFNQKQNKWMGWERKRGALIEFNDMLTGSRYTSYSISSSDITTLPPIKYVLTLDADTILPIDAARKLVGTMSHPLNKPVVNVKKGIVTEGYGLMQPRIGIDLESANTSLFSMVFAGEYGIDPYSNAVSDIYQDLFGEGIFTGKGIYDLKVFQRILKNAIPENTVLSHDLLEGSYVRTGLVTDIELIDSYPSKYNSNAMRMHRWVRGDWQLLPWLSSHVRNRFGSRIKNPLSSISKWKILDNMRRSLISPALMLVIILGFSILPGNALIWLAISVLALASPLIIGIIENIFSGLRGGSRGKYYLPAITGFKATAFRIALLFIFLPYQAFLMLGAVIISLLRVLFTGKNLLEWVTASDAEKSLSSSYLSYWRRMGASLLQPFTILILSIMLKHEAIPAAALLLFIWSLSPIVAYSISRTRPYRPLSLSSEDLTELRVIARKTWRYFEEFVNHKNNYLAPDNYQQDPPNGVAYRTSPTNIGLGLMSILAARDLGYTGTQEMARMIANTMSTIEKMEKWNGHLYNWYDTRTLKLLRPRYVSTVDSGNFVCYLVTLSQGMKEYLSKPLIDGNLVKGLIDTVILANREEKNAACFNLDCLDKLNYASAPDIKAWYDAVNEIAEAREKASSRSCWKAKVEHMIHIYKKELQSFASWVVPLAKLEEAAGGTPEAASVNKISADLKASTRLKSLPALYTDVLKSLDSLAANSKTDDALSSLISALKESVTSSLTNLESFIIDYNKLIRNIDAVAEAVQFAHLYNEKKQLFSIGYNIEENKLTNSYYDLLASEARQASFIAIARGEVEKDHWFKMGRTLTMVDNYKGLVSWSGTMFEYLMPYLIMKSYRNSLLDETHVFAVRSQIKYGKQRHVPWGTSESGFYSLDINLDYQYKAFGIPWLGLKRGLIEDVVVAPYATMLALPFEPQSAVENLKYLSKEGVEGSYGYYEAVDYTPERLPFGSKNAIVKSYMVHHQGMSLLSINNYINNSPMQERFHAVPVVKAAQLLLQEKVPYNVIFTKDNKEKVTPFKDIVYKTDDPIRTYRSIDNTLPKVHMLSNGSYSVMLTDKGTGYSRSKDRSVTRWREDSTLDSYGMFFYIRNMDTNTVWSSTYAPLNVVPSRYAITFSSDKVKFHRVDGSIDTTTEIVVSPGDNTEIRRIALANHGKASATLEVTSYYEVVLAQQNADIAHPVFSNLFVRTEYVPEYNSLLAGRRSRSEKEKPKWLFNAMVVDGETFGGIQYETDRMQFTGRGRSAANPIVIEKGKPLSNSTGAVLDPIMCLRRMVKIDPGQTARISYITGTGDSREAVIELVQKYNSPNAVDDTFRLALTRTRVEARYLNLKASEITLYQEILSHILFLSPLHRLKADCLMQNTKGQSSLWPYGISGDLPVVLVMLKKTEEIDIIYEALKAHEYWRIRGLSVDLAILNEEESSYTHPLNTILMDIVSLSHAHDMLNKPGGVFIINGNNMSEEDRNLLCAVARILLKGSGGSLSEQLTAISEPRYPEQLHTDNESAQFDNPRPVLPELSFFNGIGGFKPDGSEYVIHLEKDQNTPLPWINVISNQEFGFLVTESGGGYTWCGNSRENKLTPWSNDPVSDTPGEVFYMCDADAGSVWTPTPLPARQNETYVVRHGFGYSVFELASHGIQHELTQFVPVDEPVKVSILKLINITDKKRNLTVTYYIRPVLGVSDQYTSRHITSRLDDTGALLLQNPYNDEFPGHIAFIDASIADRSITCNRQEFFGKGKMSNPGAFKHKKLSGSIGAGYDPCAAIQVPIALNPGEKLEVVFTLGMSCNMGAVKNICLKYRDPENAHMSLKKAVDFWKHKLSIVSVNTPDPAFNIMLNGWLLYQVVSCRIWARSAFYQSGGAYGFRDQLQDCLALVHIWPELTYKQILLHSSHQFVEGDVQHWWHEPKNKGTRTRFSDDLLWLPYAVAEYIRVTDDYEILDVSVPFLEDKPLEEFEDERYGVSIPSKLSASVYDHCVKAIERSLKFGEHGIPLIGSGDWNDGMNAVGNKGKGESIWLGWFLYLTLNNFSSICHHKNDSERAEHYEKAAQGIAESIDKNAWDGGWYLRAYFDNGTPLGSINNAECKIDSISQSWAVISGGGKRERAEIAMEALDNYLVDRSEGLIKLLTPPFDSSDLEPGYIKGYVPGVRENGGQYTHASAWSILAFAMLGKGDRAGELFDLINPINHSRTQMDYSKYKVEPYVMSADVYAVHPHNGRGGWTWYTGSAGWVYKVGLEYILGFRKNGATLIMDPCVPGKWDRFSIKYTYGNTIYNIAVLNPDGINKGVKSVSTDGNEVEGNTINLVDDGLTHDVIALMAHQ